MDWLQAGVHVVGLVGGIAGASIFLARKLRRFKRFTYPPQGEAGPNLLSPEVTQVTVQQHVSLSAVVPEDAELLVTIRGEPHVSPAGPAIIPLAASIGGAWFYSVAPAPLNWRANRYSAASAEVGAHQNFKARGGPAELDMHFGIPGLFVLSVYERGAHSPTWTKEIRVVSEP